MKLAEPSLAALSNPLLRYFLATRPPFLSVSLFACMIGLASAFCSGVRIDPKTAVITLFFALVAHAGVNVLNDYYDALNGTDAINTERVFPYTGGSRFIQNGVLSPRETAGFGAVLFALVILAGFWLAWVSGAGLLLIGASGLVIGWGYSAPPLKLNSRGVGEVCVALGFALIAVGADYVQRGDFFMLPAISVAPYALLVTNILYINQFPDYRADAVAGKHHWVVRLGPERARWGYIAVALVAYASLLGAVATGGLPLLTLAALLPAFVSARAARALLRNATQPRQLTPAIKLTIFAACLHGLLMALGLLLAQRRV